MKKTFYLFLVGLCTFILHSSNADAYVITSHTVFNPADSSCINPHMQVHVDVYVAGMTMETSFGDGTQATSSVYLDLGGTGTTDVFHSYGFPGTYTVKHVLIMGSARVDSIIYSYTYYYCQSLSFGFYYDANSNCNFDTATESRITSPVTVQVSLNGVAVDTITEISSFSYPIGGTYGDIYTFRALSAAPGLMISCPTIAELSDTVGLTVNAYIHKDFAVTCNTATGFDISEFAHNRAGTHAFRGTILVNNGYCTPTAATLTMTFSTLYSFVDAVPVPSSVVGNVVTWNFPALTAYSPEAVYVHLEKTTGLFTPGDVVNTSYVLTPITGDLLPANNTINCIDTVRAGYDPNEKSVKPEGFIAAGTQLEYTIMFENTGNDTAFNIHIMDTLSNNVDVNSLKVMHSSAVMSTTVEYVGGNYIAKFDFPHINLLDSSHHGKCDGLVSYTINARTGLAIGTLIHNKAGIYFDDNTVVNTNQVTNTIGSPVGIGQMSASSSSINVFPNPVNDELTVKADGNNYNTITITNITGQVVITQEFKNTVTKVNVKALPSGIYILSLRGEGGIKVQRFEKL